jgi:hypothetical protein
MWKCEIRKKFEGLQESARKQCGNLIVKQFESLLLATCVILGDCAVDRHALAYSNAFDRPQDTADITNFCNA